MNKILFATIIAIGLSIRPVFGQCDQTLLEQAFDKAGRHTEFQSAFNVQLESGDIHQPVPYAMFKAQLNKGDAYRLAISGDLDNQSKPIIELYDGSLLVGSTADLFEANAADVMEFHCDKTSTYDVKIYFQHGHAGCASGILTRLDSYQASSKSHMKNSYDGTIEFGQRTPVQLKLPESIQDYAVFKSSNGSVEYKQGHMYLTPTREDDVEISVLHKDDKRVLLTLRFEVTQQRKIEARLGAFPSGNIRLSWFEKPLPITVFRNQNNYQVASFDLSLGSNTYHITGEKLTNAIWKSLRKLDAGSKFQFDNIIIISKDGSQQTCDPLTFYIE